ncbi:hypothetical protein OG500_17440 [Kitasatospora sp. NBC_01250]|uniref:hypothetical protein n=1 Tax=unclassified Kitasatospora TaxID=2633591 RepID=UPI002E0E07D8|nr:MULTISPECIES: hypothetical protein [unclassified Kitasatospora]WSJ67944.1 hypothetical protein OG294_18495 [Kitasatospora sp. NBC_01302]
MTEPTANGPEGLEGYWQGDFTLRREGASAAPAGPLPIERLTAPEITVRGRNLAVLLAPVYRALTS